MTSMGPLKNTSQERLSNSLVHPLLPLAVSFFFLDSTNKENLKIFSGCRATGGGIEEESSEEDMMKKKTKETTGKKGEKEKRENQRENDGGTSCSAGNAACGSSSRSDCAWCGAKEGSIPGILKHHQCGRCKLTFYCSESCQKRHWKEGGHKHKLRRAC